jgi:hypothetical protein
MGTAKLLALTIFGLAVLGATIAALAPPYWGLCELGLAWAGYFMVRECLSSQQAEAQLRSTRDPVGGGPAWK